MKFTAKKFNAPKVMESFYGKNPYSIEESYDPDQKSGEFAVIEWVVSSPDGAVMEEVLKFVEHKTPFTLDTIVDAEDSQSVELIKFAYRPFTLESEEGPQLPLAAFEVKVPAKGSVPLPLEGGYSGSLEAQPRGYASCKFEIQGASSGTWCGLAVITGDKGKTESAAGLSVDGSVSLKVGVAGNPKSVSGEVMPLGANQWIQLSATL
jgi:hypothetical protein